MSSLNSPRYTSVSAILLLALASFVGAAVLSLPPSPQVAQAACAPTTATLALAPIASSYVDKSNPTLNYGGAPTLNVELTTAKNGLPEPEEISYMTFNMSAVPKGMKVEKATLSLELVSNPTGATGNVSVYSNSTATWNEISITYLNAPTYSSTPLGTNATITGPGLVFNFTVTSGFSSLTKNMTLVLGSNLPSGVISFDSRHTNHPPDLTIDYGPITDCTPPVISPILISPPSPSSEDLITVSANVTSSVTISSVDLSYSINSSRPTSLPMAHGKGNSYSTVLDRQSSGSVVSLNVTAVDEAGLKTVSSEQFVVSRPSYYYSLLAQYNNLVTEYNKLEAAFANLTATLPPLQSYKSLQASEAALQNQYNNLLSSFSTLTSNYQNAQNQIANLTKGISSLSTEYNTVSGMFSKANSSLNKETSLATIFLVVAAAFLVALVYVGYVRPRVKGQHTR